MLWVCKFLMAFCSFLHESSSLIVIFSTVSLHRLCFFMKNMCIRFISITNPLRWWVWVEWAHFGLIESICSLFSMVLFFYFFTLTHALESTTQSCFFLLMQLVHQWPSRLPSHHVLEFTGPEAVSVCSGEIHPPQTLYLAGDTGSYKIPSTAIVILQMWHDSSKCVILF